MTANRQNLAAAQTAHFFIYYKYVLAAGVWDRHIKTKKKNVCVLPFWPHSTQTYKKSPHSSPAVCFKSVWRTKCRGKDASPSLEHPLTSICAITPFDTWFHVTRWPTGWTTKTRNRGSRYKWPPSGQSFHPVGMCVHASVWGAAEGSGWTGRAVS